LEIMDFERRRTPCCGKRRAIEFKVVLPMLN
jgi:hypothetical protein